MNVIIFGTGKFYQRRKDIFKYTNVVAFLDNNRELCNTVLDGKRVMLPQMLSEVEYDNIVLMSAKASEMKAQLLELGVPETKILYWEKFRSEVMAGTFKLYCGDDNAALGKQNVLVVSTELDYNGGTLAAVYAVKALKSKGYNVVLAAPDGNDTFIKETIAEGVNVVICPSLPYINKEELVWVKQFDVVIVNVYQMIAAACEISKVVPVLWWIHEPSKNWEQIYDHTNEHFAEYVNMEYFDKINIKAVSSIPKATYNSYYPDRIKSTMAYGIPDMSDTNYGFTKSADDKMIFAIVGGVIPRKAQLEFVQAVSMLSEEQKQQAEFWIIGGIGVSDYCNNVRKIAEAEPSVKITGQLSREEIYKKYKDIDVVVCPSLEDPLPIVMTEGMMFGKICISSDANGTADFITDGDNGFVCKAGDVNSLYEKLSWLIDNRTDEKLQAMRHKSRAIYDEYFSMESFANRLEEAVMETVENYKQL